jgi:tripartite ATP-independent transporter DctP family solute receptor
MQMKGRFFQIAAGVFIAGALVAAPVSQAADLKFAFQNVADHPQGQGAKKFAELVGQKTGGKLVVKLFPGGTLGGDLQTLSALQGGTVEITVLNAGLLSGIVKDFAVVDLPFMFNEAKEADAVVDGPVGQKLFAKLGEKNLVGLAYWDLGFRNLTNSKRPVAKMEDLQGLKIRVVQSPVLIETYNTLGANAVPMPFPEVYSALEQKTVDGHENPYTVILAAKINEVQKYLSNTRHVYNPQALLISKKTWDKLSADEKKAVQDAAKEATAFQRQLSRQQADVALDSLKKAGMQYNDISAAEIARMREKVKPVVDKFSKDVGEPLVKEVQAEIDKVRGKK